MVPLWPGIAKCPDCGSIDTKRDGSHRATRPEAMRARRVCLACGSAFKVAPRGFDLFDRVSGEVIFVPFSSGTSPLALVMPGRQDRPA